MGVPPLQTGAPYCNHSEIKRFRALRRPLHNPYCFASTSLRSGRYLKDEMRRAVRRSVSPAQSGSHRLEITVVFTGSEATPAALAEAAQLASGLRARITLLVPCIVPYPLPLNEPPVPLEFLARRFKTVASAQPVETTVALCACRDRLEFLKTHLPLNRPVVIGSRKRWWPTREARLARQLERRGHDVILVASGK